LLVPLGENFLVCDLIQRLNCEVVVIARNSLGTLNHTLLTVNALKNVGIRRIKIVLMANGRPDASSVTNKDILSQILSRLKVYRINFLGKKANKKVSLKNSSKKIKKTLARISD
jgi:dethiobiotin synthetase